MAQTNHGADAPRPFAEGATPPSRRCVVVVQNLTRGGAERQAVLTAHSLREHGHDVRIFVQTGPDSLLQDGTTGTLALDLPGPKDSPITQITRLRALLEGFAPDAVITFQRGPTLRFGIARALSTAARRAAWVVAARGNLRLFHLLQSPSAFAAQLHWQRAADRICVNAASLGPNLFAMDSALGNKVVLVPNVLLPFEVDRAAARAKVEELLDGMGSGPVVGCIGSFQTERNHVLLAEALPRVLSRHPTARVLVVGRNFGPWVGRFADEFVARIAAAGLSDRVRVVGELPNARRLLPGFDVFAVTSKLEGSSNALAEAMIAGTATATTPVGDAVDLTDGAAVVSRGWTGEAFAEAMLAALDGGDELRARAADRGRALLEAQSPARVGAQWAAVVQDAVAARRRRTEGRA